MGFLSVFLSVIALTSFSIAEEGKEDKEDKEEVAEKPADASSEEQKKEMPPATFYDLAPIIIPIIKGDKVEAYVRVVIQIVTKDQTSVDPFRIYKRRLRDAYFSDLFSVLCDQWLPGTEPNQDTLKKRLQRCTNKIAGEGKLIALIKGFYFYKPEKELGAPTKPNTSESTEAIS